MKFVKLSIAVAALLGSSLLVHAETRFLAKGHTDLALQYDDTAQTWNLYVGSDTFGAEFAPNEVILKVKPAAQTTVPASPNFAFLGAPASAIWILPQAQNEDILYLGYGGDDIPDGVFVNNQVTVALKSVSGPGDFFSYRVDGFGNPQVLFNSADGISGTDVATVQSGGDAHLNWAFTQPGEYTVVLEASGTLVAGNKTTSSGPVTFMFSVGEGPKVLTNGHTDLALDYHPEEDAWDVHVGSDALEQSWDADDALLVVEPEALTVVPTNNVKFAFLGAPGDSIWILPQAQNEEFLYLGYGGDGIPDGTFVGNQVKVTLKDVKGPANGNLFSYRVDGFGNPEVLFNTADGISSNDVVTIQAGGDAHLNWAFTQPGEYSMTLQVSGTLVEGNRVALSDPVTFTFSVMKPRTLLTNEHVDLRVQFDANATNKLTIVAKDEDHQTAYASNEVYLVVSEASKLTLPAGTPFGNEGDVLWAIPQSQNPDLLYLGISAEGVPAGSFTGTMNYQLLAVDGPGKFFVWQSTSFGNYNVVMNTGDGITDADKTAPLIGSHEHYNWGFTTNGTYKITFQVSGTLAGSTNVTSLPTTFTFQVLPLPTNAPPVEIELQATQVAANGDFLFNISGAANLSVEVQGSDDLKEWTPVASPVVTSSPQTITIPADKTKAHRFFRVQQK